MSGAAPPETWIQPRPKGFHVFPGDFYIDPTHVVENAVITHGHGDHARPGHRLIALLREAGYDRPIHPHETLRPLCALYERFGVDLGDLRPLVDGSPGSLAGEIVLTAPRARRILWDRPASEAGRLESLERWVGLRQGRGEPLRAPRASRG